MGRVAAQLSRLRTDVSRACFGFDESAICDRSGDIDSAFGHWDRAERRL